MEERPPSRPRVAWEENRAPQESSSPPEPHQVCVPGMQQTGALTAASRWLALYRKEKDAMEFIETFLKSSEKEEAQKRQFLETICTLCKAATRKSLSLCLIAFCQRFELAENIKVLLEEEPRDHLHTAVRQKAMLAIAALSKVEVVLEGKKESLLQACFRSVFLLPPKTDMQGLNTSLYLQTLDAMDTMLQALVLSSPASSFTELQTILEACSTSLGDDASPACHTEIRIPILGQLLGRLILCHACKNWEISWGALDALHHLFRFLLQQKCMALPEANPEHPERQREREAENTSWLASPSTSSITMAFGKYLQPSEKRDVVLVAIEAMRDSSIYDKEEASSILDVAMKEPDSWLAEVPSIVRCIYENMACICMASARHRLDLLLLLLTDQCPGEVVTSLLKLSPSCDSSALAVWDVMLSQPHTLKKVLRELLSQLQDQRLRRVFSSSTEDACIHHLAVSDQTSPCSPSGLCLPLQENRHGPLPSHLPQTVTFSRT
ncbi:maestro heat-like repeat-containing protein family member 7 [Theristicus caerulescens]